MKRFLLSGVASALFMAALLIYPGRASANEGVVNMRGAGTSGSCYAASVFIDGTYRVLMTCRELKIALSPEKNKYVAWVENEEVESKRLGEISNGKLSALTSDKFTRIFITVESEGYGNAPSEDMILTGFVEPINFGAGIESKPVVTPTPTPTMEGGTITPTVTRKPSSSDQPGLGSALGTIFRIALLGFGVLLLIVGVFSFLSRRRSL